MTTWFPLAVAALETGAALVYLAHGDTRMTILWGGYAAAAWVLAGLR